MQYTVYLGSKCNMNCPYCHREEGEEWEISATLLERLKKADFVRFMGGEPTLYMGEVRKVVEACPNAKFAITTNGMLFDKYKDYFMEHKFQVCFSYDGASNLRGFDPFTKHLDYPWVAVSCTLYHGNTDFKSILLAFAEKEEIIGRPLSFFPHIVHQTYKGNSFYGLSEEELTDILAQYKHAIERFTSDWMLGVVNKRWQAIMCQLLKRYHANYAFGETYCVNRSLKKVDTIGHEYSCQYIRDEELKAEEQMAEIIKQKFSRCEKCKVYDMCGAACVKSIRHDLECYFYKNLFTWFRDFYKANEPTMRKIEELIL